MHKRSFAKQLGFLPSNKEDLIGQEFLNLVKSEKTCKRSLGGACVSLRVRMCLWGVFVYVWVWVCLCVRA